MSPFHFDGSFGTLFPTLFSGGAVVIRPREALLFPRTFFNAVKHEAHHLHGLLAQLPAPAAGQPADRTSWPGRPSAWWRWVARRARPSDVRALWDAAPGVEVFNRYGPTETTIAVTHAKLTPETHRRRDRVRSGSPIPGVTFHLVDDDGAARRVGRTVSGSCTSAATS